MKIVMLAPSYAPLGGGVEKHVQSVTRQLLKRGHEVVILVRYNPKIPRFQEVEGVQVWRLPRSFSAPALGTWVLSHWMALAGADLIHSHDIYPRHLRKFLPKLRWVHTFHGYEGWPLDEGVIASRKRVRREVDYCIGVGAFIEKWYGTKLDAVTYGAAEDVPKTTAGPEIDIVMLTRLEEDTGFKEYLQGFEMIHKRHPSRHMVVLGDGSLRAWGEQFAADNKLPVEFKGWVKEHLAYRQAAKVLFGSGYQSILEGARLGKPVVAQYNTPIKKDYLEMHPLAKEMVIVSSPEDVSLGYERALKLSQAELDRAAAWAREQTWGKLATIYETAYGGNK
jgi:glycosyltransferase involved in cell wall biosynthesis